MILNIFAEIFENFNQNIGKELYGVVPIDFILIFIIAMCALIFILIILVFIFPVFKRSDARLFQKYLELRDEMARIDKDYSEHKMLFKEYVSKQFYNAQEYYKLVKILSSNEKYKEKLKNYTLKENFDKLNQIDKDTIKNKNYKKLSNEELISLQVKKLAAILRPKASKFTKEDIYAVLVYEGFNDIVIKRVLQELIYSKVDFSKVHSSLENREDLSFTLNNFFEGNQTNTFKDLKTSESISFDNKDLKKQIHDDKFKYKSVDFDNISDVDKDYKSERLNKEKPGFFKRLFKKKEKPKPTLNEIDNIFKNIEQELKKKEL